MKSIFITSYFLFICLLNIVRFNPSVDAFIIHRIVGGKEVSIESYPYIASLRESGYHFCGGAIISLNLVLTAAHCKDIIKDNVPPNLSIVVGETTTINSFNHTYAVSNVWAHSKFDNPTPIENDIALFKIVGHFVLGTAVQIIPLNRKEIPCGEMVSISGWGLTDPRLAKQKLRHLRAAKIPIVCSEDCAAAYESVIPADINDKKICLGYKSGGVDTCQGDSGGPIAYKGKLIGIVSFAYGCADGRYPGVNTKVSAYIDWIEQFMD